MTAVQIYNMALTLLGVERVTTTTEASEQAAKITAIYDQVRRSVLRSHPWNFSISRAALAMVTNSSSVAISPPFDYSYYHTLPTDCLRVIVAVSSSSNSSRITDYAIENGRFVSDESTVYIKYIYDVTDTEKFDVSFNDVFVTRLAADAAFSLTGKPDVAQVMMKLYEDKIRLAKTIDAQESSVAEEQNIDYWTIDKRQ